MKRKLGVLGILLVLVVAVQIWRTLSAAGVFTSVPGGPALACAAVPGAPGAEDMALDRARGLVYVSSLDRRAAARGPVNGGLYRFSLHDPADTLTEITPPTIKRFAPHGLSLYTAPNGTQTLYVVNHATTWSEATDLFGRGQVVEVFTIAADGSVLHRKTVSDPTFFSLNDVVAVDENRFYVTNDHGSAPGFARLVEDYALWGQANVVYFDGTAAIPVATGLTYANGVNLSPDGDTLYVAETTGRRIARFDVERATGALKFRATVPLGFGVDNIDVDADGVLWVAGHPKLFEFLAHAADPARLSPSQAVSVRFTPGAAPEIRTRFADDGTRISGASIAVAGQGKLVLGSVFGPDFLVCDLP